MSREKIYVKKRRILRKFRTRSCRALLLHIPKESGGTIGSREKIMQKKRVLSLILALSCTAALLGGCAGSDTSDDNAASGEHEVITMNAPYRNISQFYDLVHEKYPEINLEIIPYNGENTSS